MEQHQSEPLSMQEQMRILFGLIPKKRRIILALMLDVIACFVVIFFVLVLYLTMFKTSVPVILGMSLVFASPIIFQEPFLIVTGGTFGMFLTQIAYVDGSSGLRSTISCFGNIRSRSDLNNTSTVKSTRSTDFFPTNYVKRSKWKVPIPISFAWVPITSCSTKASFHSGTIDPRRAVGRLDD